MFSKTELTQKTYQTIKIVKLIVAILANTNMVAQSRKLNIKKCSINCWTYQVEPINYEII